MTSLPSSCYMTLQTCWLPVIWNPRTPPPPPPLQLDWMNSPLPAAKVNGKLFRPHVPHKRYSLLHFHSNLVISKRKKEWQERIDFGQFRAAMVTLANSRWSRKVATIWRFQNELESALQLEISKWKVTTNYNSCFTAFWIFFYRMTQSFRLSCLSCPPYKYII